jgi:23S rRNA (guanosine2251-2'-O)-methyltransferase
MPRNGERPPRPRKDRVVLGDQPNRPMRQPQNRDYTPTAEGDNPPTDSGMVGGLHAVEAVLRHNPDRVQKLWLADSRHDKRIQTLANLATAAKKLVQWVPMAQLDRKVEPGFRHQGAVAAVLPKPAVSLEALIANVHHAKQTGQPVCIVVLDHVTDPHNIGAVMRTMDAVGATALLLPKRGGLVASPVVGKASAGASETMDCVWVANLAHAIGRLKEAGCWVVGTMCNATAQPYHTLDWRMPTVLVLGAEGEGLGPLLQAQCDFAVMLPMHGQVQSLNVSCAASVLLYTWLSQQALQPTAPIMPSKPAS